MPRESFVLSTKVGRLLHPVPGGRRSSELFAAPLPFDFVYDYSAAGTRRSLEDSLQRLGLAHVDMLLIHDVVERWHGERFLAQSKGIAVLMVAPFNSGILATGAVPGAKYFYQDAAPDILERTRRMEAVCAAHGVPLAAAALQFSLGHPAVATVVVGARSRTEVETNAGLMTCKIPAALWADLKTEGLIPAHAPTPTTRGAA